MKRLKEIMSELDQTINLYKITEKQPYLANVVETMNKTLSIIVEEKDIGRILFFVSEMFEIKWVQREDDFHLVISYAEQADKNEAFPFLLRKNANERLKVFEEKCFDYLRQQ